MMLGRFNLKNTSVAYLLLAASTNLIMFQNCSGNFASSMKNATALTSTTDFNGSAAINRMNDAFGDVVWNFWQGDATTGHIKPTWNGYVNVDMARGAGAPSSTIDAVNQWQSNHGRGGQWDHSTFLNVLYFSQQLTGAASTAQMIASDWNFVKSQYSQSELQDCRDGHSSTVFASDDAGWEALAFVHIYQSTGDSSALDDAKAMINCTYSYYATANNSQYGIAYNSQIRSSGMYEVGLAMAAYEVGKLTGDSHFSSLAMHSYSWMQQHLQRRDGIYYMGFNPDSATVQGTDRPNDFSISSSVTYLAGNIGMAVLNARLYQDTGDVTYLNRAIATAQGLVNKMLDGNGALLNDRDAWTDGAFAIQFAQEVVPLPGMPASIIKAIRQTAQSISANTRTSDGYYSADWGGGSAWDRPRARQ